MKVINSGVTRKVFVFEHYVIKIPQRARFVRGWLANRSECKQGHRDDVNPPLASLFYFANIYYRAQFVGTDALPAHPDLVSLPWRAHETGDDSKPSSWGLFGYGEEDDPYFWRLIDFDNAHRPPWGFVGFLYYMNQERLARKWMHLPGMTGEGCISEEQEK